MSLVMHKHQTNSVNMFDMMEKAYKFSEIMAQSDIIPQHYRNKPANVFIAVQSAYRMDLDPMLVMQNTYVVSGKLGMNSTFAISLANKSGLFENGIRYRSQGEGDNLEVTAYTNLKKSGEEISYTFSFKTAIAEGYTRNSKYKTMPELMLRYRAATLLIRTHSPEVLNGMHMVEELEDVSASEPKVVEIEPQATKTETVLSKLNAIEYVTNDGEIQDNTGTAYGLKTLIDEYGVPDEVVDKWCAKAKVTRIDDMTSEQLYSCVDYIKTRLQPVQY